MSVDTRRGLTITRTIRADRDAVWDAWTQPAQAKKWSCPVPGGVRRYESDLRVGGAFTLAMEIEGQPHTAVGRYREIEPPSRLVYTWDWKETPMGETLVTVEFDETDGATLVTLTHTGLPNEAIADHEQGWTACMAHFEALFD
jgi:uncharacterized protein YndB with AHSA1/START domain